MARRFKYEKWHEKATKLNLMVKFKLFKQFFRILNLKLTWEFPGNRQQSFNNQQGQAYASPVRKTNDAKIVLKKSYFRTTECLQRNKKEGWKATKWSTRSKTCSTWMTKHWLQQKRKDVPSNSQVYFQKPLFSI